jgi:hypothetical protein
MGDDAEITDVIHGFLFPGQIDTTTTSTTNFNTLSAVYEIRGDENRRC